MTRTTRREAETAEDTGNRAETGEELRCPECDGSITTDERRGETVCTDCGVVVDEEMVDRGPEWRAFDAGERDQKARVGAPRTKTMHDEGLSTKVGWRNKDANGQSLSPREREKMARLRTWDERFRTKSARERNLKQALGEVDRMASALGLPENVRETASVIYRRALEEDLLPGRSIEAMATAALYAAARQAGQPRSLDEFETVSRVDQREFARAYRYIGRELELAVEPADPERFLPRFSSELGVSEEGTRRARELLAAAKREAVHSGKSPVGLAAAAIYAASTLCNERITQQAISEVTDVSEVTIRNRYQELLDAEGSESATV